MAFLGSKKIDWVHFWRIPIATGLGAVNGCSLRQAMLWRKRQGEKVSSRTHRGSFQKDTSGLTSVHAEVCVVPIYVVISATLVCRTMTDASERAVFRCWYLERSRSREWWRQQLSYVEKHSMPVREQSWCLGRPRSRTWWHQQL